MTHTIDNAHTSDGQPRPNSKPSNVGGISCEHLRKYIERIEHLTEEKKVLQEDIKEVFAEARASGFDPKIMRMVIKIRAMDRNDLDEQESLLDMYLRAIGMKE